LYYHTKFNVPQYRVACRYPPQKFTCPYGTIATDFDSYGPASHSEGVQCTGVPLYLGEIMEDNVHTTAYRTPLRISKKVTEYSRQKHEASLRSCGAFPSLPYISSSFCHDFTTYLHGAEPFFRSRQSPRESRNSMHYGSWRFITLFTTVRQWTLSWARYIRSQFSYLISLRCITILSSHLRHL